ncbi:MAG: peptidylprolyl isomerase, partial [Dehalococcoidia bacterium]
VSSEQVPTRMSWRPRAYGDPAPLPVFEGEPVMLSAEDEPRGPIGALDQSLTYSAVISTEAGDVAVDLFDNLAPMAVENFINLSRIGFYDGLEFNRVVEKFISQAGDPVGDDDGPGYVFNDEFTRELLHDAAGVLSMANGGSNTNGSQFFITHDVASWLDAYENDIAKNCADDAVSCHTVFGRVTSGLEIVTGMTERDPETATEPGVKILSISIIES